MTASAVRSACSRSSMNGISDSPSAAAGGARPAMSSSVGAMSTVRTCQGTTAGSIAGAETISGT